MRSAHQMSIVPYSTAVYNVAGVGHAVDDETNDFKFHEDTCLVEEQIDRYTSPWTVAMNAKWTEWNTSRRGRAQQKALIDVLKDSLPNLDHDVASPFDSEDAVHKAQEDLLRFFHSGIDADIRLCFPGPDEASTEILCHRWALECHCGYYEAYFGSPWFAQVCEESVGPARVQVTEAHRLDVQRLVEYCYGGKFPCYETEATHTGGDPTDTDTDTALRLLRLVHRMVLPGLQADIERLLAERHAGAAAVCRVLITADALGLTRLKERTMSSAGELLHRHLRGVMRHDCSFEQMCAAAGSLLPGFNGLPPQTQASLYLLQRTFHRYQQVFGTGTSQDGGGSISARELISILAECLEEDSDRYSAAWERLQVEVRAFSDRLGCLGRRHLLGELLCQLSNIEAYTSAGGSTLNPNTNSFDGVGGGPTFLCSVFGFGLCPGPASDKVATDMLAWRDRIIKVDSALNRQRAIIDMQREFYLEQRTALRAGEPEADWSEDEGTGSS